MLEALTTLALVNARRIAGVARVARTAMIAITTNSSIRVNPPARFVLIFIGSIGIFRLWFTFGRVDGGCMMAFQNAGFSCCGWRLRAGPPALLAKFNGLRLYTGPTKQNSRADATTELPDYYIVHTRISPRRLLRKWKIPPAPPSVNAFMENMMFIRQNQSTIGV